MPSRNKVPEQPDHYDYEIYLGHVCSRCKGRIGYDCDCYVPEDIIDPDELWRIRREA
uniref:Uncharacterized protein n=1 Tax=viral metagenome TaxID=1070528 RepID=A0A6M3J1B1_9ZZZZ